MDQQSAEKVGMAVQAIACAFGGAAAAIALAGVFGQASNAEPASQLALPISAFFGLGITTAAAYSITSKHDVVLSKKEKCLCVAVLIVLTVMNSRNSDFQLRAGFQQGPWTQRDFSQISSACFFLACFLVGLGAVIRMRVAEKASDPIKSDP